MEWHSGTERISLTGRCGEGIFRRGLFRGRRPGRRRGGAKGRACDKASSSFACAGGRRLRAEGGRADALRGRRRRGGQGGEEARRVGFQPTLGRRGMIRRFGVETKRSVSGADHQRLTRAAARHEAGRDQHAHRHRQDGQRQEDAAPVKTPPMNAKPHGEASTPLPVQPRHRRDRPAALQRELEQVRIAQTLPVLKAESWVHRPEHRRDQITVTGQAPAGGGRRPAISATAASARSRRHCPQALAAGRAVGGFGERAPDAWSSQSSNGSADSSRLAGTIVGLDRQACSASRMARRWPRRGRRGWSRQRRVRVRPIASASSSRRLGAGRCRRRFRIPAPSTRGAVPGSAGSSAWRLRGATPGRKASSTDLVHGLAHGRAREHRRHEFGLLGGLQGRGDGEALDHSPVTSGADRSERRSRAVAVGIEHGFHEPVLVSPEAIGLAFTRKAETADLDIAPRRLGLGLQSKPTQATCGVE